MPGPNMGGYYDPKGVNTTTGAGGDQYKYAANMPANLDSTPIHELSQNAEAHELPADYGPGYAR